MYEVFVSEFQPHAEIPLLPLCTVDSLAAARRVSDTFGGKVVFDGRLVHVSARF